MQLKDFTECVVSAWSADAEYLHKEQELMKRDLIKSARQLEDAKDNMEGMAEVLETGHSLELWTVVNDIS